MNRKDACIAISVFVFIAIFMLVICGIKSPCWGADTPHFRANVRSFEISCYPDPLGPPQTLVVDLDGKKIHWKRQVITDVITDEIDLPTHVTDQLIQEKSK